MKGKIRLLLLLLIGAVALTCDSNAQTTYTATNSAGWNTASTWDPNGIPGAADTAIIPAGRDVTYGGTTAPVGTGLSSGTFSPSATGTLGDGWVDTPGSANGAGRGASLGCVGS